jgi:pimeloyl-[acyl-carrier protein] methyl ester esterase
MMAFNLRPADCSQALPLVLVHGWGFGPAVWQPLLHALLPLTGAVLTINLWDPDSSTSSGPPALPPAFIGVGHSLGALWLLRQAPESMRAFISIAGFTRFPGAARVLHRMQQQFQHDPETVLATFRQRCGGHDHVLSGDDALSGLEKLAQGLEWLRTWQAPLPRCPVLALHGAADCIVPLADAQAQFPDVTICADAPHALPLSHPAWCAAEIRSFLHRHHQALAA